MSSLFTALCWCGCVLLALLVFDFGPHGTRADDNVLSCHCNSTVSGCSGESGQCSMPKDYKSLCQVFKEFEIPDPESGGMTERYFSRCIKDLFEYEQCQTHENAFFDGLMNTFTVCCTDDYCNTASYLEQILSQINSTSQPSQDTPSQDTPSQPPTVTSDDNGQHTSSPPSSSSSSPSSPRPTDGSGSGRGEPLWAYVTVALLSFVILVGSVMVCAVLLLCYCPRQRRHQTAATSYAVPTILTSTLDSGLSYEEQSLNELLEDSGSGSGLPLLIQRSIAGQISLQEKVGKGRFGEVWKGSYKGDDVAVKIFHTIEESSWKHEVDIYQTCLMRHPNILRFIAADNRDVGVQTQLWLITEFCERESLYDFLGQRPLTEQEAVRLCCTAACGLNHLHTEIVGTEGKPAIVHRDMKSRNVLVKGDLTCCIADLGLALRYDRRNDSIEELATTRVGTRRYLSPEVISDTLGNKNFEAFKRSDIYSFGLVLWEIARRGLCGGVAEERQLPYFSEVPPDPSFEDMEKAVVMEGKRPAIPNRWSQSEVYLELSKVIQQCWHKSPEARSTALRVKKSLANLQLNLRNEKKGLNS